MSELLQKPSEREVSVVYGVYDSRMQPLSVRMRDFFVDRKSISIKEKSYFYHLLGVMIDAGIPIMKSLRVLSKKTENERFARIINTLAYDVERGKKISQSMTKFPDIFKESEVGIVKSGETIGNMADLLFKLAGQTERTNNLIMKVRGALIYPITVLVALMISGAIVVTTVIPKIRDFFLQANADVPPLTDFVLNIGTFLINFSWFILIAILIVVLSFSFYVNTESGRRKFDRFLLSAVWISDVIRKLNVATFVQMLSILVGAGVAIHEAIRIASESMNNSLYKDFLIGLKQDVERGERIAENLAEAPFLFPETVTAMISVGETTGSLSSIASKLAKHYEREVEQSLENFTTILEPIVIVFVGLMVAVMALALLGPIFSLSSLVA